MVTTRRGPKITLNISTTELLRQKVSPRILPKNVAVVQIFAKFILIFFRLYPAPTPTPAPAPTTPTLYRLRKTDITDLFPHFAFTRLPRVNENLPGEGPKEHPDDVGQKGGDVDHRADLADCHIHGCCISFLQCKSKYMKNQN